MFDISFRSENSKNIRFKEKEIENLKTSGLNCLEIPIKIKNFIFVLSLALTWPLDMLYP